MKRINRRQLCEFFDRVMTERELRQDIVVEVSHVDGPGETIEVKKRVITVSEEESSRSANTEIRQANKAAKRKERFPVYDRESYAKDWESVPDEEIDANFKVLLERRQNGQYLTPEVVAHFEYFMNTLNMSHKNQTENPFDAPLKYPALQYRGMTVLQSHTSSDAIMESADGSSSSSSSEIDANEAPMIIDTDDIIDQSMLLAAAQMKRDSGVLAVNKTPQADAKLGKRLSVQQQRKLSVRQEIRRQSNMYVQNLSIYERNQLLIKPNAQLKKVRDIVKNDKKSILLSQGSDLGKSDPGLHADLIDNEKIQHKIIRNSINMLRPKGTWYPNQEMENALSAKFSGSPQPKQFGSKLSGAGSDMHKSARKPGSKQGSFKLNPARVDRVSDFGAEHSQRVLKFQSVA